MTRQIKAMLYFSYTDIRQPMLIFWSILTGVTVLSFLISIFIAGDVYLSGTSIAIYIFCGISGFVTVRESLPFCIQMGATRKNFFFATSILFLLQAAFMSIVHNLLLLTALKANNLLNIENIYIFRLADLIDLNPSLLLTTTVDFIVAFFFLSISFLMGMIFYRYGLSAGAGVLGLLFLLMLLPDSRGYTINFFTGFTSETAAFTNFLMIFFIGVFSLGCSWLFIRKVSVIQANHR